MLTCPTTKGHYLPREASVKEDDQSHGRQQIDSEHYDKTHSPHNRVQYRASQTH